MDALLPKVIVAVEALYGKRLAALENRPRSVVMGGGGSSSSGLTAAYYDTLVDSTSSATYIYLGKAPRGSATSAAVWSVWREAKLALSLQNADGDTNYDNVWDNRATTITYS